MARVTRSQKIDIPEDQTTLAINTPLPDTPAKHHAGLVEINITKARNTMPPAEERTVAEELKSLKAAYRIAIGAGKKGRKGKNKKKDKQEAVTHSEDMLVPCQETEDVENVQMNQVQEGSQQLLQSRKDDIVPSIERSTTPHTPATRATNEPLAGAKAAEVATFQNGTCMRSTNFATRTLEEVERSSGVEKTTHDSDDDSFVEQIISRSPAKQVSRIEDSVEALDQLEEAIEALDQAALAERIISLEKMKRGASQAQQYPGEAIHAANAALEKSLKKQKAVKPGFTSVRVKPTTKNVPFIKKSASMTFRSTAEGTSPAQEETEPQSPKRVRVTRPASLLPPKKPAKSTKPATRPTFELPGEAVALKLKEQREARLARRESSEVKSLAARTVSVPKIKSTKPPTKPSFELPGEAVSRKKREAHEARLLAQEEEERQRREFKAKPHRKSVLPNMVPRDTVASRARQSKIGLDQIENGNLISKRASTVVAHPSIRQLNVANISAPRSPGPAILHMPKAVTTVSSDYFTGRATQRTLSTSEMQTQRQRSKEISNRDARFFDDHEREKREREAALKRSREEAAERGRQASREWAEKQRAKKMSQGDKGMSAGYALGGQIGLKV